MDLLDYLKVHAFLSAWTREVSRRAGSGDALEALGLEGPTETEKVERLGGRGFETRQFRFSLTPEPARGQPGGHVKGEVNF